MSAVNPLYAQINNTNFSVDLSSTNMGPCGGSNNGFTTVGIQVKRATLNTFKIAFDLPDGVVYEVGTLVMDSQTGSSDFILTEFDVSNLNAPVFQIERPSNANWQTSDFVEFTFEKSAACDAVQYSYSGGLFKDIHSITYLNAGVPESATDNNLTINSYSLLKAYIAVEDLPNVEAFVGQTYNRNVLINNSGNGSVQSFEHEVTISNSLLANYQLSFNGTALVPTSISGNVYTYEINLNNAPFIGQVGDFDNEFENETITLSERLILDDCSYDVSVTHSPRWGCVSGTFCQIGAPIPGNVIKEQEWGYLSLITVNEPRPRWDAPVTFTYGVNNDLSADNAYNVKLNIGFGWDGRITNESFNPLDGDDNTNRIVSNFRFTGGSTFTPQRRTSDDGGTGSGSYYIPQDFFNTDPDGPGGLDDLDGDGFFDDLAPGETTEINLDLAMDPDSPVCNEWGANYVDSESLRIDVWNLNTCGNTNQAIRKEMESHYVNRGEVFNWSTPADYELDAEDGTVFNLSFTGHFVASSNSPTCNGIEMFSNDPSTRYRVVMDVPVGITLDGSADSRYTQVGNQIIFVESNLADFEYNSYILQIPINIPLNIDCSTYAGPEELELPYTTSYESSCYTTDLHCSTFDITTHCPSSCTGPTTTSFDANRVTAGWTDETMSAKVVLDPSIHATKYYMPKDEMQVVSSAIMGNDVRDNLHFKMRYVTDSGLSMADIISFTGGTITINDISTGSPQTFPISNTPVITTQGTNDNFFTLDLSSYQALISPTYRYGEGLEEDEITVELSFEFKDDFPETAVFYEFHSFQGSFYSLDASNNEVSCGVYNDRAFFFQDDINMFDNTNDYALGCNNKWLAVGLSQASGVGDKFPDEFRPPTLWESTIIQIPDGMVFNNLVDSSGYPLLQPEGENPSGSNNGLNYSVSGNMVTITPGPRFIQLDQGNNNYPQIMINITTTSATPASSFIDLSVEYQKYAYAGTPIPTTDSANEEFKYIVPTYYINSDMPTVIGHSEIESFTIDICKDNNGETFNNWLRVDSGTGYTITNAYLVDGATETPLSITTENDIAFIEFGYMETGNWICRKIRFEGIYTSGATQEIKVSHNFDCVAYPSGYAGLTYHNEEIFTLDPVEAAIQLQILDEPTTSVDTCAGFDIELEARNAGEADLISPILDFDIPGDITSLLINSITIEYPNNSGNIQAVTPIISGNNVSINLLDHTAISSINGILGSLSAANIDEQIAIIRMNLSPQCNYLSNTGTAYTMVGNNPYGTPATGSGSRISANPIIITGAEPPYSTNTIALSSPNFMGCETETVSVETSIIDGVSGTNDFSKIELPPGLSFVDGSLVSTGTRDVTFVSNTIVGDHEEIIISLPSGADINDLIAYNFQIESTADICEGNYDIDLSTYVTVTGLSCMGVACGTTEVITGFADANVTVTKGYLESSSFVPTATYAQLGANTNYDLSFGLENTGSVELNAGITYDIYCADGSGVKTGVSIYSGTISQAIAAGSSIQEDVSFTSTQYCGDNSIMVVEFQPGTTNCFCSDLSLIIASQPSSAFGNLDFVDDNITVNEADGTATLEVIFTGNVPGGFTVDYLSTDNTATAGSDYLSVSSSLSFSGTDGEILPITIFIYDDDIIESVENLFVNLLNPTSASVTILDDQATVNIVGNETDNDNDNIADVVDLDDDNDGILDSNESQNCIDDDYLEWGFNSPVGTRTNDFVQNPSISNWMLNSISNVTVGSGISDSSPGSELQITGITASNYTEALLQNDYIEVGFTTEVGLVDPIIERMGVNWYRNSDGTTIGNSYDAAIAISKDNFITSTLLNVDVNIHYPTDGVSEFFDLTVPGISYKLEENTSYTVRVYAYNQSNDGNVAYSVFDDFTVRVSSCQEQDSDGDTIPNHLDEDSDDDGCVDAIEAGHTDPDNDGELGNAPITVDALGQVLGQGGYTGNNLDVVTPRIIVTHSAQPSNVNANVGDTLTFAAGVTFNTGTYPVTSITYTWQLSVDNGTTWSDLSNGGIYSGVDTDELTITNVPLGSNTNQFRLRVFNITDRCLPETFSNAGILLMEQADLSLVKSVSDTNPEIVDNIGFSLNLTNDGPNDATNVSIEDIVPLGYMVDATSITNGGTYSGGTITWNMANVGTGTLTLSYNVTVNAPTGTIDEYKNIAQVTASDQTDPDSIPNNDDGDQSEDDEDSTTITIIQLIDIGITKTVDPSTAQIGDLVTFTVAVENLGNVEVTNVLIEEDIPDGFELIGAIPSIGTYDEQGGVWSIPTLSIDETAELLIEVRVQEGMNYTNVAELISMDQIDQNDGNDRDEATVTLIDSACLKVYNEFSPNGDQSNEYFFIDCIEDYPNNHLEIYNRWGNKVFETFGYKNDWDGTSQGRSTVNRGDKLPVGTYYYILELGDNSTKSTSGWLYITR